MVFTTKYKITFNPTQQLYYLRSFEVQRCLDCGGYLVGYDHRKSLIILEDGIKYYYYLRRLKCPSCQKLNIELSSFCMAQKHYIAKVIDDTKEGAFNDCHADDSTIRRWKKEKQPTRFACTYF